MKALGSVGEHLGDPCPDPVCWGRVYALWPLWPLTPVSDPQPWVGEGAMGGQAKAGFQQLWVDWILRGPCPPASGHSRGGGQSIDSRRLWGPEPPPLG